MFKFLTITIFTLLFFQTAKAQKQDTLLYYMKNNGRVVSTKDSADYIMLILPLDSATARYPVQIYYPNGKRKLVATSLNNDCRAIKFDGTAVGFFENGKRKDVINYKDGKYLGDFIAYYPNGKLYYQENIDAAGKVHLIECRDTIGNVLATGGSGKWIFFDDDYKSVTTEGNVADSLQEGEWHGLIGDKIICVSKFKKGKFISGVYHDINGKNHPFTGTLVQPIFNDVSGTYSNFLQKNIKYPAEDRENNVQGKVIINFIIERDGTPSNFKVIMGPDQSMEDEAIREFSKATWIPELQNGMPVRSYYTLPVSFSISEL